MLRRAALTCLCAAGACTEPPAAVDAGVDAPIDAPTGQGSEATGPLVVNEIVPRGPGSDWIELHNRGAEPLDLCGYFLTDVTDRLDHYLPLGGVLPPAPCPPLLLEPGGYRVITVDDTPLPTTGPIDPTRAPFSLGSSDQVHVLTIDGANVDGVAYLYPRGPAQPADVSLARIPDGVGLFYPVAPTPGAANPAVRP